MHLSQFLTRLCGPLLFSAAFVAYVANFNTFKELTDTVRSKFTENEVYYQSSVEQEDQVFSFDRSAKDPTFSVRGEYVLSLLSSNLESKIAIVNDRDDVYQKVVINPTLANGTASYTVYKNKVSAHGSMDLQPVSSALWIVDSEFPLHGIVDITADYNVTTTYNSDGTINCVTAQKA